MNNKGFTLIEIMCVIVLLGLMGSIAIVNLNKYFEKKSEEACTNFVKEVEMAACTYAGVTCSNKDCSSVTLETLINEGYIDLETNECSNDSIDINDTVSITWTNDGEKICEYRG